MITWEKNEDLPMLFAKCVEVCQTTDYAILIISQFPKETQEDGRHFEVICNFYPDEESRMNRDQVALFSLEPEVRFKSPERAVVAFPIEYIMTSFLQGKMPYKDIFMVTSLGDVRDIVRYQIPKSRARKSVELENIRSILLKDHNLHTIKIANDHPYHITSYHVYLNKRKQDQLRQQNAESFNTNIGDVGEKILQK